MNKLYCFLIVMCASCTALFAQDYSFDAYPKKIDLSLGGRLFSGEGGLMNFYGMEMGFRFHPDWAVRAGYSAGIGNDWESHRSDIADLGIAKVYRNSGLKNVESFVTFGCGFLWDRYPDGVNGKVLGMVGLESRLYFSPKGFFGITAKTYAGKDYVKSSWLGITWGIHF